MAKTNIAPALDEQSPDQTGVEETAPVTGGEVKVGDSVEYCTGTHVAGVDADNNTVREPDFVTATVVAVDEDRKDTGHVKLSYPEPGRPDFKQDAWAHHFAGRPGYWQFKGEEPAKDDE